MYVSRQDTVTKNPSTKQLHCAEVCAPFLSDCVHLCRQSSKSKTHASGVRQWSRGSATGGARGVLSVGQTEAGRDMVTPRIGTESLVYIQATHLSV